ncbi:hypothetical protein [Saccharopolyspora shandongensis]|uniref:hypothetical protein n=1 Tax=Saccharopolyspora shandongensis TaxID=418495 RepID=UPI0033CA8F00
MWGEENDSEEFDWRSRIDAILTQYASGNAGLDVVAEILMVVVSEVTSRRGETYEQAYNLAGELERYHDLRTSRWNTPDDVRPEDDQDLKEVLGEVRRLISKR